MSFTAGWGVYDEHDLSAGVLITVETPEQVDAMVDQLAMDTAEAAKIVHDARPLSPSAWTGEVGPDHQLWAGVWKGYGYLMYVDPDHELCQPVGDPDSPVFHSDSDEFEAGTGIPVETFTRALKEFLATAERPTCVEWRDVL
ncbi:Imm1 family immunity protein [Saccharothrix isguenensis]